METEFEHVLLPELDEGFSWKISTGPHAAIVRKDGVSLCLVRGDSAIVPWTNRRTLDVRLAQTWCCDVANLLLLPRVDGITWAWREHPFQDDPAIAALAKVAGSFTEYRELAWITTDNEILALEEVQALQWFAPLREALQSLGIPEFGNWDAYHDKPEIKLEDASSLTFTYAGGTFRDGNAVIAGFIRDGSVQICTTPTLSIGKTGDNPWYCPPERAYQIEAVQCSAPHTPPVCPDCNDTKVYEGLYTREPCRTCQGAQ